MDGRYDAGDREKNILGKLSHPNVVAVLGEVHLVVEKSRGIVMELCDQNLDVFRQVGRRLSEEETVHIISQMAAGIAHVHEKGFIHR